MREIRFRAFDKRHKHMYYTTTEHTVWAGGAQSSVNSNHGQMPGDWEIMQFTGRDNIYEGDIVKATDMYGPYQGEIQWWNDRWVLAYKGHRDDSMQFQSLMTVRDPVIIGNIYEHAELLSPAG